MKRIIITLAVSILLALTIATYATEEVRRDPVGSNCIDSVCSNHHGKDVVKASPPKVKKKKLDPIKDNPKKCNLAIQYVWNDYTCHNKPRDKVATVARSVTTRGVEQWRALVSKYDWNVNTVLRIMQCESNGNPSAVGDTTTAYASYGLMQIRGLPGRPGASWLLVPANNVQYAYQMSNGGKNFSAWSCY